MREPPKPTPMAHLVLALAHAPIRPYLTPLGLLLLFATIAALTFPLIYSAVYFIEGRYLLGAILLPLALLWSRLCSRFLNKLLAGIEHSSL